MKRLIAHAGAIGGVLFCLYEYLFFWQHPFFGWLCFFLFFALVGNIWREILVRAFRMRHKRPGTVVLSLFAVFVLLGCTSGIFAVWYTLSPFFVWLSYALAAVVSATMLFVVFHLGKKKVPGLSLTGWQKPSRDWKIFHRYRALSVVYVAASVLLLVLFLVSKKSDATLFTPWQSLHGAILPVWFVLTALLGLLLFSKQKTKALLFFVLLHSLLTHLYLPMAHTLPWGGDTWRHIGIEQKLADGAVHLPVIAGPKARWREVFGADVPEALIIPHKYIYGQFWGTAVLLSETLHLDLLTINIWLMPILWSLVLPFLFFRIGRVLFGSWRSGLLLAWLSVLLFPFQALGGLTLPVSLGSLVFFFVLALWLQYMKDGRRAERSVALLFACMMLFQYTLYFLLIWLVIALSFFIRNIAAFEKALIRRGLAAILLLVSCSFFPLLEIFSGASTWPVVWDWMVSLKQYVGQFSGWYYASGIRPHDIVSGNIFFNHTPAFAFVSTLFTDWRWHVMPVMALFFGLAACGYWRLLRRDDSPLWRTLGFLSGAVFVGYVWSWFILSGDHSFVRRLDIVFGFLVSLFFLFCFSSVRRRIDAIIGKKKKRLSTVALVLLLSWFGATAYAGGPDLRVVSKNEYDVARYIWETMDKNGEDDCVLADTWVLLPLEGFSSGRIVGGGFPIDAQFGQATRVALLAEVTTKPSEEAIGQIHSLTGASSCWFVVPIADVGQEKAASLKEIIGLDPKETSGFYLWHIPLKKNREGDSV